MPPNEMATTSDGLEKKISTINGVRTSENERKETIIEAKLERNEAALDRIQDTLRSGYRSRKINAFTLFFHMVCSKGRRDILLLLFGILCALLSGCIMSSFLVFTGRIKHILLTHEPRSEEFRLHAYEQVYAIIAIAAIAFVTNFCLHIAFSVLSHKILTNLHEKYDDLPSRICKNRNLQKQMTSDLSEKIHCISKGSENFELLCRSISVLVCSTLISFYHEFRLTFVMLALIPICIGTHVLSEKFGSILNDIGRSKLARTTHMEKEILLLKNFDERNSNEERLVRLSGELSRYGRYTVLKEVCDGAYEGFLCFVIFTFIGCGMLYGGYLLEAEVMDKQGDIFIVVLSVVLLANMTRSITSQWKALRKAIDASVYIKNMDFFGHDKTRSSSFQNILDANSDISWKISKGAIFKAMPAKVIRQNNSPETNDKFNTFVEGSTKILKNNRHDRLRLAIGFLFALLHGLELPAYNLIMWQVFNAMLEPRINMMHKLVMCLVMFASVGLIILILRTLAGALCGIVTDHIAVGFRVNLARHFMKPGKPETDGKMEICELVDDNVKKTADATSFYHPHTTRLIARMTSIIANIVIGFVYSWQVALLGTLLALFCFITQLIIDVFLQNKHSVTSSEEPLKERYDKGIAAETLLAISFSVLQTSTFAAQTVCYALTTFIVNNGYKYPDEAFLSVITMYSALHDIVLLPELIKMLSKSSTSAHRIFSIMCSRQPLRVNANA